MTKPKEGQKFWFIFVGFEPPFPKIHLRYGKWSEKLGLTNTFRTKREAEKVKRQIEKLLKNTWR